MTLTIKTSFTHLCDLARAETEARASGDPERIAAATAAHEEYRALCCRPGVSMSLHMTRGDVDRTA
jgi:hypothetical protein